MIQITPRYIASAPSRECERVMPQILGHFEKMRLQAIPLANAIMRRGGCL